MGEPFCFSTSPTRTDALAAACCARRTASCETPAFMPVGTRGAVKAITHATSRTSARRSFSGNTYHLHLRPGDDLIARAGGLHRFIGWTGPILTDSGGYQVFSLAQMRKVEEERRHVPIASRRRVAHADARDRDRHPGAARIRHRDGARRVHRERRPRRRDARDAMERSAAMGPARADTAAAAPRASRVAPEVRRVQPGPGPIRDHPGRDVSGPADRKRRRRPWRLASRATPSAA